MLRNKLRERTQYWLAHVTQMDHQSIAWQVLYWEVLGFREDQVGQGQMGEALSRKIYQTGTQWEEAAAFNR